MLFFAIQSFIVWRQMKILKGGQLSWVLSDWKSMQNNLQSENTPWIYKLMVQNFLNGLPQKLKYCEG